MKNEIIIFEQDELKLEVPMQDETVWLTQKQIARLFDRERTVITRHINNIFKEEELDENKVCANFAHTTKHGAIKGKTQEKEVVYYNLDMIISVGYRVKSKRGIQFRQWANKVLKKYLLKGYVVNQKRLEFLEKVVEVVDIANRIDYVEDNEAKGILKVIGNYTKALDLLDSYDHQRIKEIKGQVSSKKITYEECIKIIRELKYNERSSLFALERDEGLRSIIANIYQTFDGKDVYPTIEEKAANFLYMVVKDHIFIDGNKRIAATLFIYFLQFYNKLFIDNRLVIDNNALVSMTLLIAESNPKEKNIIVHLIINFLDTSLQREEEILLTT